jgi:hypothetical protein
MLCYFTIFLLIVLKANSCNCDQIDQNLMETTTTEINDNEEKEMEIDLENELEFEASKILTCLTKLEMDLRNLRIQFTQMENLLAEHSILIRGKFTKHKNLVEIATILLCNK